MTAPHPLPPDARRQQHHPDALPANTEGRIVEAFSKALAIPACAAAKLIGVDVKTLGAMTDAGDILAVPRGKGVGYSEAAVRAWLLTPAPVREKKPCPSTNTPKARTGTTTSSSNVVAFTDRPASQRAVRRKK